MVNTQISIMLATTAALALAACGDGYANFTGQASDGSLIASDLSMAGINSITSGNVATAEDLVKIRLQSTKGWDCSLDYNNTSSSVPDNALPIKCSNGATGYIILNSVGRKGFTFGLNNGVTGSVFKN